MTEQADRLAAAIAGGYVSGVPRDGVLRRLVGSGQSYDAWQVSTPNRDLLVRVARRSTADMPRPIAAEFAALELVPPEFGTHGVSFDESADNALGAAYVVTTFVPGAERPAAQWGPPEIAAHSRQVARFHHAVGNTTDPSPPLIGEAMAGLDWWREARPDVVNDPRVQRILPVWETYLREREDAWDGATRHRLIHSDLVVSNIVVGEDQVPRYVDWEWGEPGDVSKDLAMLGGTVHGGPWYVPMTDQAVAAFVQGYADERERLGSPVVVSQVARQRDAWEVAERLLGCLHFLTRASEPLYAEATDEVLATLAARLGS